MFPDVQPDEGSAMTYRWKIAGFVLVLWACAWSCGDKKGASPQDVRKAGEVMEIVVRPEEVKEGPFCGYSSHCEVGFCDKLINSCVECYVREHCPDDSVCMSGSCMESQDCGDPAADCGKMACDEGKGHCVECLEDSHCSAGKWCWNQVCRVRPDDCDRVGQCTHMSGECAPDQGLCLDCDNDGYCANFESCEKHACLPEPCTPGKSECLGDDDIAKICRADGKGFYFHQCPDKTDCIQGVCVEPECSLGDYTCVDFAKSICVFDQVKGRLAYQTAPCPAGEVCIGTDCRPLRHRALFVFDTSGSMNWLPQTEAPPKLCDIGEKPTDENPCMGIYPGCEFEENPITKLGISKKVFGKLLKSEEAEAAFCALMRFPQILQQGSVNCDGGMWQGTTWLTGHEANQEHAVPEGGGSWFEAHLAEVLLEPFPANHDAYVTWNVVRWFNFGEDAFYVNEPCPGHPDCEDAWCIADPDEGCEVFNDPELMANGWTPLGRTLFYAGEYLRRHVMVDGKECDTNQDCGSAGYLCSPAGKCFDPLYDPDPKNTCRQNIIVVFTDGQDTESPANTFFHPAVQAKRFHFGLGCKSDDDCQNGATCQDGVCYHPSMQVGDLPLVDFVHEGGPQSLLDRNGNPISLTIHVVDASGPDEINQVIAANGGGEYYAVSVEDEVDFLKKLILTLDIKTLAQNCLVNYDSR